MWTVILVVLALGLVGALVYTLATRLYKAYTYRKLLARMARNRAYLKWRTGWRSGVCNDKTIFRYLRGVRDGHRYV